MRYIDLGLPSGTLWADRNIGANNPEDRGLLMEFKEWDNSYEVPTNEQFEELINECTWTFIDGLKGYKVVGKNGNKIFLPTFKTIAFGYYWSASPYEGYSNGAYNLFFYSIHQGVDWSDHYYGLSVRPVKNN